MNIELIAYGVGGGFVGGLIAAGLTFLIIERNSRKVYKKIEAEAKKMSHSFKATGLDNINSSFLQNEGSNKNWH